MARTAPGRPVRRGAGLSPRSLRHAALGVETAALFLPVAGKWRERSRQSPAPAPAASVGPFSARPPAPCEHRPAGPGASGTHRPAPTPRPPRRGQSAHGTRRVLRECEMKGPAYRLQSHRSPRLKTCWARRVCRAQERRAAHAEGAAAAPAPSGPRATRRCPFCGGGSFFTVVTGRV